jgi:hypothetical protein
MGSVISILRGSGVDGGKDIPASSLSGQELGVVVARGRRSVLHVYDASESDG